MNVDKSVTTSSIQVLVKVKVKIKVWVLVIALLTRLKQQRFTIPEVADDWHELMIPWRIMRPSIAREIEQLDPRCSTQTYRCTISALGLHPVAHKLLLISRPAEGRKLSWPEHTACSRLLADGLGEIHTRSVKVTSPILSHYI